MLKNPTVGTFTRDKSGLYHYKITRLGATVDQAASDALLRKSNRVTFFWFNGTPTPIKSNDTSKNLVARWHKWHQACRDKNLLSLLQELVE